MLSRIRSEEAKNFVRENIADEGWKEWHQAKGDDCPPAVPQGKGFGYSSGSKWQKMTDDILF